MADLVFFIKDGKLGFRNKAGKVVIPALYDYDKNTFNSDNNKTDTFYIVRLKGKTGLINSSGNPVIPFEYKDISKLFDDLYAVCKEDDCDMYSWQCGVIRSNGTVVVPLQYGLIIARKPFIQCIKHSYYKRVYGALKNHFGWSFNTRDYSIPSDYYTVNGKLVYEGVAEAIEKGYLLTHKNGEDYTFGYLQENNRYFGLIDSSGNTLLDADYPRIIVTDNNRVIVRKKNDDHCLVGVIDDKGNTVIPFDYTSIESEYGGFFKCRNDEVTVWKNALGEDILDNHAKELSVNYLAVEKGGSWGVYDQAGTRIVSFLFDEICAIQDKLVVGKKGTIGLLDSAGRVLIDPSYNSIVNVCFTGNTSFYKRDRVFDTHGGIFIWDPWIDCSFRSGKTIISIHGRPTLLPSNNSQFDYDWGRPFILSNDSSSEIFTINDGIIPNSQFEKIYQIDRLYYIVKRTGKWGVFSLKRRELVIPCEYDRIRYMGGVVVYLCKGGLWGAKSIVPPNSQFNNVDIPCMFLDIKPLDDKLFYFSVKREKKGSDSFAGYTIVSYEGKQNSHLSSIIDTDSHFEFYSSSRILSSRNSKWGFVSLYGFDSIPFKYDLLEKRKDGLFDVRVEERWGVLSLDGKEIVAIKYRERIPEVLNNAVVHDFDSNCCGVLAESGKEIVPTIFQRIIIKEDLYFYSCFDADPNCNDCFGSSFGPWEWGVLNPNGKSMIPPIYENYSINGDYLVARRKIYLQKSDYFVYASSLYTKKGVLLFSGFDSLEIYKDYLVFELHTIHKGSYELKMPDYGLNPEDYNPNDYDYKYVHSEDKSNTTWLVLDREFTSVLKGPDGKRVKFEKGFKIKFFLGDKKPGNSYNFDSSILIHTKPSIENGYMIVSETGKSRAIRLQDAESTCEYDRINAINDSLFFIEKDKLVGIVGFNNNVILPTEYFAFTYPTGDFFFAFMKTGENTARVDLIQINGASVKVFVARSAVSYDCLLESMVDLRFIIKLHPKFSGLKAICVRWWFDREFHEMINAQRNEDEIRGYKEGYEAFYEYFTQWADFIRYKIKDEGADSNYEWE